MSTVRIHHVVSIPLRLPLLPSDLFLNCSSNVLDLRMVANSFFAKIMDEPREMVSSTLLTLEYMIVHFRVPVNYHTLFR